MAKNDLINDMKFRRKCGAYGLDWGTFNILDDIIVLPSPKENILVLLDEHYNTVGIYDKNDDLRKLLSAEKIIKGIKELYEITYVKFPYPFQNFSLKQIVDLANSIYIDETNHGHSSDMFVNGEMVNDEYDSVYIALLSYIKFLGEQIEQYFMNLYQMKMMGLEYPNVYQYISSLMSNIDECINTNIKKGNRPIPIDVIEYLGQDRDTIDMYEHELYRVIDLLLKQKGIKIKSGFEHYRELEMTEKDTSDLSEISKRLLKILEVPDEEVQLRYQENSKTHEFKEINLQEWLLEDINKTKKLYRL